MRFVFLIPELATGVVQRGMINAARISPVKKWRLLDLATRGHMRTDRVYGGTLNLMRHCAVARDCGADAVLATLSGRDTYGETWGVGKLPTICWKDRRSDDVVIVPDIYTKLIREIRGPVIAYLQNPIQIHADFDYQDDRVRLWTDSPFMKAECEKAYPEKHIEIVPNVVDNDLFRFVPQSERTPGLLLAFPRKGPEYITSAMEIYRASGGTYWRLEEVDGLPIRELAEKFRHPQAFLASADVEGCALPPQESMASGIVVVGKDARGANFSMQHRKTAMVASTPEEAAESLVELESAQLRERISETAYSFIRRYFPTERPAELWYRVIETYSSQV